VGWAWNLPMGLTEPPAVPDDNPMSVAKVGLGHKLFMDKRLSVDGSRSCYSCHQNELGNADGREKALGAAAKPLSRNSPTIWNVAYHAELYWDGRAKGLEKQGLGALKGGNMGLGDQLESKAAEVGALPEYAAAFSEVFGLSKGDAVTSEHVTKALSAYERTLLCGNNLHDRQVLGESATRGWKLFSGKAACITCHTGPNMADGLFHNVGIGVPADGKAADGVDLGRGKPSKDESNNFKFRTPTLRNVSRTAPYFHDGSVATLEEAVKLMASGGVKGAAGLDEQLRDQGLNDEELADLVGFLRSLDCVGKLKVIGDQTATGIGKAGAATDAKPAADAK
jgi:cytochrome c peroxidase